MNDEAEKKIVGQRVEELTDAELPERIRKAVEAEYQKNVVALNHIRVLEFIPEFGEFGIRDENGNVYPLPKLEDILENIERNWEFVAKKWRQGFTRLQLTPMASAITTLMQRVEQQLRQHKKSGQLFLTADQPGDQPISASLNFDQPTWFDFLESPLKEQLIYLPQSFDYQGDKNFGGMTKEELIEQLNRTSFPGWSACLVEDYQFLPHQGKELTFHGRRQLSTKSSGKVILHLLTTSDAYQGETGFTYEDALTYFALHLHDTNEISFDWEDRNETELIGNYLRDDRRTPDIYWDRQGGNLYFYACETGRLSSHGGCRTVVRLE